MRTGATARTDRSGGPGGGRRTATRIGSAVAVAILLAALVAGVGAAGSVGAAENVGPGGDAQPSAASNGAAEPAAANELRTADELGTSDESAALDANLTVEQTELLVGEGTVFDASGTTGEVVEYEFDLGHGGAFVIDPSEDTDAIVDSYDAAGNYTVELTAVGPDGDTDTDTVNVTVAAFDLAVGLEVSDDEPVVDQPVEFDVVDETGPVYDYHWRFDGENGSDRWAGKSRQIFRETGTHTVSVTAVSKDGQEATATTNVTVSPQNDDATIDAAFEVTTADPTDEGLVRFDAGASNGTVESYYWEFGDGLETLTTTPDARNGYRQNGTYEVSLTVVGENATDTTTAEVVVGPPLPPNASFTADDANVTTDDTVWFDARNTTGHVEEYQWAFGDGETRNTTHPRTPNGYDAQGTYAVELTVVFADGTTDTANATVTVDSAEELAADLARTGDGATVGERTRFYALGSTGHDGTYRWQFGDGTTEYTSIAATTHTYTAVGNYTVELTVFAPSGKTDTATLNLTVDPYELGDALDHEYEEPLVVGEPAGFGVASPGYLPNSTQHWNFGDGTTYEAAGFPPVYHAYDEPGTYAVEGQIRSDGDLAARTTENVTVVEQNESAQIEAAIDVATETPTNGSSVQFDASPSTGNLTGYWWDLETRDRLHEGQTVRELFEEPGTYDVTLTVVGENATDETTVQVEVAAESSDDGSGDESSDDDSTDGGGFTVPSGGGAESQIEIASVDVPDAVEPDEPFDIAVDVENTGDATGTTDVIVVIESAGDAAATRELDAGTDTQVTFTLAAPNETGSYDVQTFTTDDQETVALTVEDDVGDGAEAGTDEGRPDSEADEDSERDDGAVDDTAADDESDADGTPGFGLGATIVAIAAALVARYQSGL